MYNKEDFNLTEEEINSIIKEEPTSNFEKKKINIIDSQVTKDDIEKAKKELIKNVQLTRRIYKEYVDIKLTYVNDKFEKFKNIFDDLDKKYKFLYLNFKDIEKKIFIIFKTLIKLKKFHPEYVNTDYSNINNISDNTSNNNLNIPSALSNTNENIVNNNRISINKNSNDIHSNLSINSHTNNIDNSNNTNSIHFNKKSQISNLNQDNDLDNNNSSNYSDEEEFNHKENKKTTNTINYIPYKSKIIFIFKSVNKNSLLNFYNKQKKQIEKLNNKILKQNKNIKNNHNFNGIDDFYIFEEKHNNNNICFYCYIKFKNRRKIFINDLENMEYVDINGKSHNLLNDLKEKYNLIYCAGDDSPQNVQNEEK